MTIPNADLTGEQPDLQNADLWAEVVRLGLDHDHHESDLYLRATREARELIRRYAWRRNVTIFAWRDGFLWFDVPFAFMPWWDAKR